MNKPHDWKVGDRFEFTQDHVGYKYSHTAAGTRGTVTEVYDGFLVGVIDGKPHQYTISLNIVSKLSLTATSLPVAQFVFKVGDWVTTPSIFGYGQITQIDTKPSISNRFYVEFGGSGGSYWMHESELTLMPSAAATWAVPTAGKYQTSASTAMISLPPGTSINYHKINRVADTHTPYNSETLRAERKAEGRCLECGDLLPMSSWGLGECPTHPTITSVKQ